MTKLEKIYNYLSGNISNKSFRKWLMALENEDHFFIDSDYHHLKALSVTFSCPAKIKSILQDYIDFQIVRTLVISKKFQQLVEEKEDILIKLQKLEALGQQLKDKKIIAYLKPYHKMFMDTPRLVEKENWNEKIFLEKRQIVMDLQEKIMVKIVRFNKLYHFEYKE
jgi:hypothetical protein